MVHSDLLIFDNVIRITMKIPSIRIFLSKGSLNGKNRIAEVHPTFLSILTFGGRAVGSLSASQAADPR